jgi:ABC-type amino acid transport substrate-binding protein
MRGCWRGCALVAAIWASGPGGAAAQEAREVPILPVEPASEAEAPRAVGIRHLPPFAIVHDDGRFTGIAVEMFRLAAEDLGLDYALSEARGDVPAAGALILPVAATAELEARADLTHPIYSATLGLAQPRRDAVWAVVSGLASWAFLRLVLGLSVLLLIVGAVIWAIERRRNEMFATQPVRGMGDGFWWAGVTLTTIGYGDKAPVTFWGRAVAMMWMLVGLAVSSALTAAVVTLAGGTGQRATLPDDLGGLRVVLVEGGLAEPFARREGLAATPAGTLEGALDLLRAGEADAVLAAAPRLAWALSGDPDLSVDRIRLDPLLIAFALPDGDPLLEPLNAALLRLIVSEAGRETVRRYLPDG